MPSAIPLPSPGSGSNQCFMTAGLSVTALNTAQPRLTGCTTVTNSEFCDKPGLTIHD